MTILSAHGTLKIDIADNVIMVEAGGPWNIEYLDNLHQQLMNAAVHVDINNYGLLLALKGEAIPVDKGLEYHLNFIRQGRTRAVAVNLAECTTSLLTKSIFSKLYRSANIHHQFFDNSIDAQQWLALQMNSPKTP
jgi:hypothetical protein